MMMGRQRILSPTRIQILSQVTREDTRMESSSTMTRKLVPQRGWKRVYLRTFSTVSSSPCS